MFIVTGLFCLLFSCERSIDMDFPEASSQIIVDGWIEQNTGPRVIVTRSLPYFSAVDSASFRELVISKAKVSVSVDSITEVLTLHHDPGYFPPWIYQGFRIKGEVGKTYHLEVELGNKILTASTSIPSPPSIDSLGTINHPVKDTLKQVMIHFTDDPSTDNYYRLFSQIRGFDDYYKPAYGSVFSDHSFNGSAVSFPLFKGYTANQGREDLYFSSGDTVYVKFCTINAAAFQFWKNYQSEQMNSINPFASSSSEIEGNVQGEGKGIWTGYGVDYDKIIIPGK